MEIKNRPRVLITGVSGDAGQGIIKGLRESSLNPLIIGTDYQLDNVGFHLCDVGVHTAAIYTDGYIDGLLNICIKYNVDIVISGIDAEQVILANEINRFDKINCHVIISSLRICQIFSNKLDTIKWLDENNLNPLKTFELRKDSLDHIESMLSYPMICKPKVGHGSIGVFLAYNKEDLIKYLNSEDDLILQEYIEGDEYTASLLFDRKAMVDFIVMKRDLVGGRTLRAQVVNIDTVNLFIHKLALKISEESFGPINLQFKLDQKGDIRVFEINPRFSGSTSMRIKAGYNEPMRLLEYLFIHKPISRHVVPSGLKIYRIWSELVIGGKLP